jgi:4-phytase/acid phosphatase
LEKAIETMDELLPSREARILAIAELTTEAQAFGEAALASDWDEARFRSIRINDQAFEFGSQRIAQVARDITRALGPAGTLPLPGYGAKIALLSAVIGRLLD